MHSLEAIILRNARAEGRETAHDVNDAKDSPDVAFEKKFVRAEEIIEHGLPAIRAFQDGYEKGRQEG